MKRLLPFSVWQGQRFHFERTISGAGNVAGTAWFEASRSHKGALIYHEEGLWNTTWKTEPVPIVKSYEYEYNQNTEELVSYFHTPENGREGLFLRMERKKPMNDMNEDWEWFGEHHCGDDHYSASYRFLSPSSWKIVYVVKGPKKDYIHRTLFVLHYDQNKL